MLSSLPQVLSGEQVRCALHISKRKCAWMLNNGFIKCQNTGKRTRKYTVLKEDLLNLHRGLGKAPREIRYTPRRVLNCKVWKHT